MQIIFIRRNILQRVCRLLFILISFFLFTCILTKAIHINYFISCILSGIIITILYDIAFLRRYRVVLYDVIRKVRAEKKGFNVKYKLVNIPSSIQPIKYDIFDDKGISLIRKYNSIKWNYICKAYTSRFVEDDVLKHCSKKYMDSKAVQKSLYILSSCNIDTLSDLGFKNFQEYYCTYMYLWSLLPMYDETLDPYPSMVKGFRFLDIHNNEIRFYKQLSNRLVLICSIDGEFAHISKYKIYKIEGRRSFLRSTRLEKL